MPQTAFIWATLPQQTRTQILDSIPLDANFKERLVLEVSRFYWLLTYSGEDR